MNFLKLNENLNIHQSLPDNPNLTSENLKKKFDEAGNKIKTFLNDLFIPELETKIPEEIKSQIDTAITKIEGKLQDLKNELQEDFNNYKKELDKLIEDAVGKSTNYGDFIVTTNNTQKLSTNIQYGEDIKEPVFTKAGYKPLCVVGWSTSNKQWNISEVYAKSQTDTEMKVYIRGNSMPNHGNIYDSTTVTVHILWVKIKQ